MAIKLNGTKGSDNISVISGENIINAGNGDDNILIGGGKNTITGGKDDNVITLLDMSKLLNSFGEPAGFGQNTINLTKGENLIIDCQEYTTRPDSKIVGKDLVLTFSDKESVTLKNFASKDVVGSNGSVSLKLKGSEELIDLKSEIYTSAATFNKKGEYKGSWLSEVIDAINEPAYGKNDKGVSINAGAGDDDITGSDFNDTITGGKGENTLNLSAGFGNDVVNLTKGETLSIEYDNYAGEITYEVVKKDLIVNFGDDSVTLKNYYSKETGATVIINGVNADQVNVLGEVEVTSSKKTGSALADDLNASAYKADVEKIGKGVYLNGAGGYDNLVGSKHNDTIKGGNGDDMINGGTGNDDIEGDDGDDTIYGGAGNDEIEGDDGKDTIYGGDGDDEIEGGKGDDYLVGGLGKDSIYGGDGNDEITAGIDTDDDTWGTDTHGNYVDGGKGDDYIYGSNQKDTLKGGDGNDFVWTMGGNDTVYGGKGHDALVAEAGGSSKLYGEAGNDLIEIKHDGDVAYGGDGDDELHVGYKDIDTSVYGTEIDATIYGGKGNDVISIFTGGATVNGEAGNDVIYGSRTAASDIIFAKGGGNDVYKYMGQGDTLVFDKINASSLSFDTVTSSRADKYYSYNEEDRWYENPVKEHTDLVIKYGKNQSVKIEDYNPETMDDIYIQTKDGGKVLLSDMLKSYYGTTKSDKIVTDKEIVHAFAGNDKITITSEGSEVYAGDGKDTVYGGAGDDAIYGEAGNDSLYGGAGYDYIVGGDGNDYIDGQEGTSYLVGGTGNDTIYGGAEYDYVEGGDGNDVIYGNAGDDYLVGNSGADTIYGGEGDDTIMASTYFGATKPEGVDTVTDYYSHFLADKNAKTIDGGEGADVIWGSDGADTIQGGDGDDSVYAFGEGSVIDLGNGNDLTNLYKNTSKTVYAGAGEDTVSVEYGKATVYGGEGNDTLWGGYVSDSTFVFAAGDGNDTYQYRGGQRVAEYCNDTLVFENISSADMTFAQDGNNLVINYADNSSVALENYFKEGVDTSKWNVYVETTEGKVLLSEMEGLQNLLLKLATPEGAIAGTIGDDKIVTSAANETIYGYQGDDILEASGAGSVVYGGEGNDVISIAGANTEVEAGKGDDTINTMRHAASVLTFNKGDGHDVITQINQLPDFVATQKDYLKFTDTTSVLNLTYKQVDNDLVISRNQGADTVTIKDYYAEGVDYKIVLEDKKGNQTELSKLLATENADFVLGLNADDTINALAGNDTVYALEGNDTIDGGDGDDRLYGGNGDDTINGGAGKDNISGGTGDDTIYGGDEKDTLYGGDGKDIIYGGAGDDLIGNSNSDAGDDEFHGGDGKDQIKGGAGNDYIYGDAGNDTIWGNTGDDYIYGGDGDDTIYTESNSNATTLGNDYVDGGAGNDLIYCGSGNDTVYGGDGNDNINGFKGDNVIYGGAGNDQLNGGDGNNYFSTGTGNDTVSAGAGNDTVLVGKGYTKIYDKGGDDLVKIADIDTAKVSLRDMAGNDVIEFTATDSDNVNVVFNIDQEGNTDYDGIRIIGDADLDAWKAGTSLTGGISITRDSGVVETIKTADGFQITSTDIDALKADVVSWLTKPGNDFADVQTALTTGTEDQVNELMAVFETANWQQIV